MRGRGRITRRADGRRRGPGAARGAPGGRRRDRLDGARARHPRPARRAPWTNGEATTASAVPPRLAILGGGVVGVEMAQAWGALGSNVTLIHRGDRLIEREEPFASEQVLESLRELGVDVRLGASAHAGRARRRLRARARRRHHRRGRRAARRGRSQARHRGHRPRDARPPDRQAARSVGDDLRVPGHDWLFAVGDVNGRAQLTHMGKYQGRLAADAILGREVAAALRRRALAARDLHRSAGRRRRADARRRPGGRPARPSRRRGDGRQRRRLVHRPRRAGHRRGSSSTRTGASSSARRSPAPRSPRRCTPPRSPSWPRSRSTTCGTPCRRSPRAASSGCACSSPTGCSRRCRPPGCGCRRCAWRASG